jgi:hypothetical protein
VDDAVLLLSELFDSSLAGSPLLLAIIGKRRELPRKLHAVYARAASVLVE